MSDLRKQQLFLLRFEKQLIALGATVAAGATAAKAADETLGGEAQAALTSVQTALMQLAQVTSDAHTALNAKAIETGADILKAAGGFPKVEPTAVIASLLGVS